MLNGKNIVLGITGGIAAYKSVYLIRLFVKNGAHVKVVATESALRFVTRVTLESISRNRVYADLFDESNDYTTEHVALTDWADIFIVAPATANIIGKYANGIADDALSTSLLAFDKQVFIAPAMNCKMWENFSVKKNCAYLAAHGVQFIEPTSGFLACGYEGKGRMAEPEEIYDFIIKKCNNSRLFNGKKAMVTAGPTYESIDPVRFIGNHSSGLMGFSIAEALAENGAAVTLITGPSSCKAIHPNITTVNVLDAQEMFEVCVKTFPNVDIAVMAAAVADYRPEKYSPDKIKKSNDDSMLIKLVKTKDILAELGRLKKQQILVGFALETDNEISNAQNKLNNKNLDFIVLNSLKDKGAGFGGNTNKITIIDKTGQQDFPLKSKIECAGDIINTIYKKL